MSYRNRTELVFDTKHNFVLNHGALGDAITSLPALIHARTNRSDIVTMTIWCGAWQIDLFKHLLEPYGEFRFRDLKEFPMKGADRKDWGGGPVSLNAPPFDVATRNRVHMVDFAFMFLIDAAPSNMNERSYPVLAPLGPRTIEGKYIVIPTNATSENKMFRASVMRPIIERALGKGFKVVLTGTKTSHTHVKEEGSLKPLKIISEAESLSDLLPQCIDMRDKTTLLELRDILGHANCVVGVDGGTIHLAGTTDVPIVYGLTTAHPRHRYIPRRGDPHYRIRYVGPRDLECSFCQSNWVLVQHFDFRNCAYDDNKCTYQLHVDDFSTAMEEMNV